MLFQLRKLRFQLFTVVITLFFLFLTPHFTPGALSQSSARQGGASDIQRNASPNQFVTPMVITQSLKDLCTDSPIDRDGKWVSYDYSRYICENVSVKQLDFGVTKRGRRSSPRLSVWVEVYTREPRDKLVDLKLDFYSGNKWIHGMVLKDIDAEEGKETVAEEKIDCPAGLFDCEDEPGVVITVVVKDNG